MLLHSTGGVLGRFSVAQVGLIADGELDKNAPMR
jgi:hypothetical protein